MKKYIVENNAVYAVEKTKKATIKTFRQRKNMTKITATKMKAAPNEEIYLIFNYIQFDENLQYFVEDKSVDTVVIKVDDTEIYRGNKISTFKIAFPEAGTYKIRVNHDTIKIKVGQEE